MLSRDNVPWIAIHALQQGSPLLKFGRQGKPHWRKVSLSADCKYLSYYSPKKSVEDRRIKLSDCKLLEGQGSRVFTKGRNRRADLEHLSFSLIYHDTKPPPAMPTLQEQDETADDSGESEATASYGGAGGPRSPNTPAASMLTAASLDAATTHRLRTQRSLDVVCKDRREYDLWIRGLKYLIRGPPPAALLEARRQQLLIEDEHRRRVSFAVLADVAGPRTAKSSSVTALSEALRAGLSVADDERASAQAAVTEAPTWDLSQALQHSIRARGDLFSWGAVGDGQCGHGPLSSAYDPALPAARAAGVVAKQRPAPSPHEEQLRSLNARTPASVQASERTGGLTASAGTAPASSAHAVDARLCKLRGTSRGAAILSPGAVLAGAPLVPLQNPATGDRVPPGAEPPRPAARGVRTRGPSTEQAPSTLPNEGQHALHTEREAWHWLDDVAPSARAQHAAAMGARGRGHSRQMARARAGGPASQQAAHAGLLQQQVPRIISSMLGKAVKQVSCGSAHTMALTATGELYTWGAGGNGRLGLGHARPAWKPALLTHAHWPASGETLIHGAAKSPRNAARQPYRFVYVAAGGAHSLGVSETGTVLAWGANDCGQLGLGDCHDRLQPCAVSVYDPPSTPPAWWPSQTCGADPPAQRTTSPAPAEAHRAQVTHTGSSSSKITRSTSARWASLHQPRNCAPGMSELAALAGGAGRSRATLLDDAPSAGLHSSTSLLLDAGDSGRPGGDDSQAEAFIVSAAAGGTFSLLLDESGRVWSAGSNSCGQLGRGTEHEADKDEELEAEPSPVAGARNKRSFTAAQGHFSHLQARASRASTPNGTAELFSPEELSQQAQHRRSRTWGGEASSARSDGAAADLGEPVLSAVHMPSLPPPPLPAEASASRASSPANERSAQQHVPTMQHVRAAAYGWPAAAGLQPDGEQAARFGPVMSLLHHEHRAVAITAGLAHAGAVMEDGSAFTWGAGTCGQLGHGALLDSDVPRVVEGLGKVVALSAGGAHTVAITINPELGEAGNKQAEGSLLPGDGAGYHARRASTIGRTEVDTDSDDSWDGDRLHSGPGMVTFGSAAPEGSAVGVPHRLCVAHAWGLAGSGQCGHILLPVLQNAAGKDSETVAAAAPSAPFLQLVTALGVLDSLFDQRDGFMVPVCSLCCTKPTVVPAPLQVQLLQLQRWLDEAEAGASMHPALQSALRHAAASLPQAVNALKEARQNRKHDATAATFKHAAPSGAGKLFPGMVCAAACAALPLESLRAVAGHNAAALAIPASARVLRSLLSEHALPLQGVAAVSAGHTHSALLTRGGLFMAGAGDSGQLGLKISVPPPTVARLLHLMCGALAAQPGRPVFMPSAGSAPLPLRGDAPAATRAPCLPLDAGSVVPVRSGALVVQCSTRGGPQTKAPKLSVNDRPRSSRLSTAFSNTKTMGLKRAAGSIFVPAGRAAAALAGVLTGGSGALGEARASPEFAQVSGVADTAPITTVQELLKVLGARASARLLCVGLLTKRAAWVRALPQALHTVGSTMLDDDSAEPRSAASASRCSSLLGTDPSRAVSRADSMCSRWTRQGSLVPAHDSRPVSLSTRALADAGELLPELITRALARHRAATQHRANTIERQPRQMNDEDSDGSSTTTLDSGDDSVGSDLGLQDFDGKASFARATSLAAASAHRQHGDVVRLSVRNAHDAALSLVSDREGDSDRVCWLLGAQEPRPRYIATEHMLLYGVRSHAEDGPATHWPAEVAGAGQQPDSETRNDDLALVGVLSDERRPDGTPRPLSSYAQELLFNAGQRGAGTDKDVPHGAGVDTSVGGEVVLDELAHVLLGGRRFHAGGRPEKLELSNLGADDDGSVQGDDSGSTPHDAATAADARLRAASSADQPLALEKDFVLGPTSHDVSALVGSLVTRAWRPLAQSSAALASLAAWMSAVSSTTGTPWASSAIASAVQRACQLATAHHVSSLLHRGSPPQPALLQAVSADRAATGGSSGVLPALWLASGGAAFVPPLMQGHSGKQWLPHTLLGEPLEQVLRLSALPGDIPTQAVGPPNASASAEPLATLALTGQPVVNTLGVGPVLVSSLSQKRVRAVAAGAGHTVAVVSAEWLGDAETELCMQCGTAFTFRLRRHHCRNCGGIFCAECSSQRLPLLPLGFINPVRVCDGCFDVITDDDPALLNTSTTEPSAGATSNARGFQAAADAFEWDCDV